MGRGGQGWEERGCLHSGYKVNIYWKKWNKWGKNPSRSTTLFPALRWHSGYTLLWHSFFSSLVSSGYLENLVRQPGLCVQAPQHTVSPYCSHCYIEVLCLCLSLWHEREILGCKHPSCCFFVSFWGTLFWFLFNEINMCTGLIILTLLSKSYNLL